MKDFDVEDVLDYFRKHPVHYATDGDLHLKFIPKEAEAYFKLQNIIKLLLHQGKIVPTTAGYKLKE